MTFDTNLFSLWDYHSVFQACSISVQHVHPLGCLRDAVKTDLHRYGWEKIKLLFVCRWPVFDIVEAPVPAYCFHWVTDFIWRYQRYGKDLQLIRCLRNTVLLFIFYHFENGSNYLCGTKCAHFKQHEFGLKLDFSLGQSHYTYNISLANMIDIEKYLTMKLYLIKKYTFSCMFMH